MAERASHASDSAGPVKNPLKHLKIRILEHVDLEL